MELKTNEIEFLERCEEARKTAFSFSNPIIVHHYDSVTGDNEILAEFEGKIRQYTVSEIYDKMQSKYGATRRKDGKIIIKPKNLRIYSMNKKLKVILSTVKTIISHNTNKTIIRLKTDDDEIKITEDHSLISLDGGNINIKKPSEADYVCRVKKIPFGTEIPSINLKKNKLMPKHIEISENGESFCILNKKKKVLIPTEIKIDETFMEFLGLWVADGCYMHRKGREGIRISAYDDIETREVINRIFAIFGATPTITDEGVTGVTCNKTMYNVMKYLGFVDGCRSKYIPNWVFGTTRKLISAFLRGYFSGDGTVSKGDINATTYSYKLAKQMKLIFLFFGIRAKIRNEIKKGIVLGCKISINCKESKRIFIKEIGFLQKRKNERITTGKTEKSNYIDHVPVPYSLQKYFKKEEIVNRTRLEKLIKNKNIGSNEIESVKRIVESMIHLNKISEIEKTDSQEIVYDFETDEGNFICENIVLKNTDGISAGAIVQSAFKKENKKYRAKWIKKLDDSAIEMLAKEKEIIFCDLGGGNKRVNELKDVLIIDHHQTEGVDKLQINPLLNGIDGGTELSSSGAAYFVFKNDVDVAITGAVGDMQSPLTGMNRFLLEEGIGKKEVKLEQDLGFYGRYSRPILQFLLYSDDPYVPGISYNEEGAKRIIAETGIDYEEMNGGKPITYGKLTNEKKKRLISALANALIDKNMINKAEELIGESYVFPKRGEGNGTYEANEFSTLLNACGRHNKAEIGVGVCMGDEASYLEANALLQYHRRKIREGIDFAKSNIQDFGKFFFIDGRGIIDEGLIGIVCGMIVNPMSDKPIFGISLGENNDIKLSSRGTKRLIAKGLNLGLMIKEVTGRIGGVGGGHRIAAGAAIPRDKLGAFLEEMGKELDKRRNFSVQ